MQLFLILQLHFQAFHCTASIPHVSINRVLFKEHVLFNNFQGFDMKKTLIALAALSVAGLASAQVSITGSISTAIQSNLAKVSGLAMTDNTLNVGVSEDLGNGLKLAASMTLENDAPRGTAFTRADQTFALTTPIGLVSFRNTRSGGNQGAALVAPANLADDQWASAVIKREAIDVVSFSLPINEQFSLAVGYVEGKNDALAAAAPAAIIAAGADAEKAKAAFDTGLGGASGAVTPAATSYTGAAKYSGNGLTVTAGYTSTTFTDNALVLLQALRKAGAKSDIQTTSYDLSAIYDAGIAKVGFGYDSSRRGYTSADKAAMLFGASVPMGAITLGANYGARDEANFLQLAAQYDLSKRTNANVSWGQDKQGAGKDTNSQYRISLNHSF